MAPEQDKEPWHPPTAPNAPIEEKLDGAGHSITTEEKPSAPPSGESIQIAPQNLLPHSNESSKHRKVRLDFMLFLATLLAAFFTLYQARISERARHDAKEIADNQLKQTAEQFRIQNENSKADFAASSKATASALDLAHKNAVAAKRSADAAEASAKLQREVFNMQQRPWIGFDGATFVAKSVAGQNDVEVTVTVRSRVSGNTPAMQLTTSVQAWLGSQLNHVASDWGTLATEPSLLPGATQIAVYHLRCKSAALDIPDDQVAVEGVVSYWDIFMHNHLTHICFISTFQLGEHVLNPCNSGNAME